MEEESSSKITMFFYLIKEGDVKEPINKFNITPKKLYIIGRSKKECDIALDEKSLSRKHAELIYHNKNEILIKDLESRNGTYINRNRIEPFKETIFSIKDVLSFGNFENQIVFYDYTNNNNGEETDKENKDKYISDNNIIKEESKSQSGETKKNINISRHSNSKSKSKSNSNSKVKFSRSRSKETQRQNSYRYSGLENLIRDIDEKNRDNDLNDRRYNDRYKNRDEYYRNRSSFERPREREREPQRKDYSYYENNNRNRRYYDNKESRDDFDNNREDNGYIKCYVTGYMMLKIRK